MNNISSNSGSPASRSSNHSSVRNLGYSSHRRSSSQSNTRQQASTNRAYAPTSDRFDSDGYQRFVNSTGLSRISSSRNNEPDMTDNSTYAIAEWARRTRQDIIRTHAPSSLYRNSLSAQIYEDSTAQSRNSSSRSEAAEINNLIFEWASQARQTSTDEARSSRTQRTDTNDTRSSRTVHTAQAEVGGTDNQFDRSHHDYESVFLDGYAAFKYGYRKGR